MRIDELRLSGPVAMVGWRYIPGRYMFQYGALSSGVERSLCTFELVARGRGFKSHSVHFVFLPHNSKLHAPRVSWNFLGFLAVRCSGCRGQSFVLKHV